MLLTKANFKLFLSSAVLFYVLWLLHDPSKAFAPELIKITLLGATLIFLMFRLMTLLVVRIAKL